MSKRKPSAAMASNAKRQTISRPEEVVDEELSSKEVLNESAAERSAPTTNEHPPINADLVDAIKQRYEGNIDDSHFAATISSQIAASKLTEAAYTARDWALVCPQVHQAHVRAAEVFMMQGKSRLAVESLEKAIAIAPQHTDKLSPKLEEARTQRDKRVDGLSALPQGVAEEILRHFEIDDLLRSKNVSRTWRQRISKSKTALNTVILQENYDFDFEEGLMRVQRCCEAIQSHSNNIQELLIGPEIRSNTVRRLMFDLWNGFRNLNTLGVIVDEYDVEALEASVKKNIRKTLKKIMLTFDYGTYKEMDATELFVPVWRLLSKFTTVTHFSFQQNTGVGEGFPQRKLPAFKSLTHLSLRADWLYTDKSLPYLKTVCRASPNLLYLSTNCPPNGLSTIRSLLPNIQHLSLNAPYHSFAEDIRNENYEPSDNIGLRSFNLYVQMNQNTDHIYALMNESKGTLEEFGLYDPNIDDEDEYDESEDDESLDDEYEKWHVLSGFSSDQLRTLNLEIKYIGTETILTLLKQCPNLTTVHICNNPHVTDELFDALLQLPKLEHLKLMSNESLTADGFESFFNRLAGRNTLKYLHLQELDHCLTKNVFASMASNVPSLTTLVISEKQVVGEDLETVAQKLIHLKSLILHQIGGNLHQFSIKLSQLPNLQKLELIEMESVDDVDIRAMVDGTHSLTKIKLDGCPSVSSEAIEYCRKYINVKVVRMYIY